MEFYKDMILSQLKKYPLMELSDLYKLIYQAAMGPGHAVSDENKAREWLENEIRDLENYEDEDTIEVLNGSKGLVRVNLRPYLKENRPAKELLSAFIETANTFKAGIEELEHIWRAAAVLAEEGKIFFKVSEINEFFERAKSEKYPAIHHSVSYRQAYKPAYRVVFKKLLTSI
jgi:hypothetical protein